jgi:hypothetical protein
MVSRVLLAFSRRTASAGTCQEAHREQGSLINSVRLQCISIHPPSLAHLSPGHAACSSRQGLRSPLPFQNQERTGTATASNVRRPCSRMPVLLGPTWTCLLIGGDRSGHQGSGAAAAISKSARVSE